MISKVKITHEAIVKLNDEQLDELVYTKAADLYLGTFGESFKDTDNDLLLKQIFAVTVLDNEVRNGGFDSFFRNSGDLANFAVEGLTIIGALSHAGLCKQAIAINRSQSSEFKTKRNPDFTLLDDQYYLLVDIGQLRREFVRKNAYQFAD